jgi:hypothetical protein
MKIHPTAIVDAKPELSERRDWPERTDRKRRQAGRGMRRSGQRNSGRLDHLGAKLHRLRRFIGATPQDLAFRKTVSSRVRIGDGNTFRRIRDVHRERRRVHTVVGNNCYQWPALTLDTMSG